MLCCRENIVTVMLQDCSVLFCKIFLRGDDWTSYAVLQECCCIDVVCCLARILHAVVYAT